MATSTDPRTVKVRHPERGDFKVTPEVAGVLARTEGFEIVGGKGAPAARSASSDDIQQAVKDAVEPLQRRIDELQQEATQAAEANVIEIGELTEQLEALKSTQPDPGDDKGAKPKEA